MFNRLIRFLKYMGKLGSLIEIMRPVNSLMVGLAIIVGAVVTGGLALLSSIDILVYAFLTGFALTGASMVINDYYDREIDAVNEPQRPIPSGRVNPSEALALTGMLSLIGLGASYFVSFHTFGIALFAWIISVLYAVWGKRTGFLGNIMVSTCVALPFIYGGVLMGNVGQGLIFSLIALLTNIGREITKGIVDIEGDGRSGIKTIAVTRGDKTAAKVSIMFYLSAVFLSFLPIYLSMVSIFYTLFIAVTDLGLIYVSYSLFRDCSRENSRKMKQTVLYLMLIGMIGFAAGNII
jgi:geranylgeranylglycerol-phosphate geranylgeranyltransferase